APTLSVQGVLRKDVDLGVRLPGFQARPVQPGDHGQGAPPLTFNVEALHIFCRISNKTRRSRL
ncbi:mCG16301, isoform CRA_c, partial [Mus musculus]